MTESKSHVPPGTTDHHIAQVRGVTAEVTQQTRERATELLAEIMPPNLPIIPDSVGWHLASAKMAQGGLLLFAEVEDAPGQEGIFADGERKLVIAKLLPRDPSENRTMWRNREIAQTKRAGEAVPDGVVRTLAHKLMIDKDDSMGLLVSKWYSRGSLREALLNTTKTRAQTLEFAERSGRTLTALHSIKPPAIIHNDIKPANFLINADGEADYADFDLASTVKLDGDSYGEPPYASPEGLLRAIQRSRSDVFSWNTVVYQMVAGDLRQSPYPGYDATYPYMDRQARTQGVKDLINIRENNMTPTAEWTYTPIIFTPDMEQRGFTPHTVNAVNEALVQGLRLIEDERLNTPDSTAMMAEALNIT